MSRIAPTRRLPVSQPLLIEDVDWQGYSRQLQFFAERPGYRLTYDAGRLEIMPPMLRHDRPGRFLFRVVEILTEVHGLPLLPIGSTTLRQRRRRRGVEPDEAFYIANAPRMAGRDQIDLRTDPPPDLAIEIDVTHSSLDRLAIYAALGVPEVWRLVGQQLVFLVLEAGGEYRQSERSRAFSFLAPRDLEPFLREAATTGDQNPILRRFREWVMEQTQSERSAPTRKRRRS